MRLEASESLPPYTVHSPRGKSSEIGSRKLGLKGAPGRSSCSLYC